MKKCCMQNEQPRVDCCDNDDGFYTGRTALPADASVTMAYVPFQLDRKVYNAETALCNGTLFPVLNKPFMGCNKR